ncbi:TKL/LISK protein kinase, partial [Sphaeroforma arctica JP610]
ARRAPTNRPASANATLWSENRKGSDVHTNADKDEGNSTSFSRKYTDGSKNSYLHTHHESKKKTKSCSSDVFKGVGVGNTGGGLSDSSATETSVNDRPVGLFITGDSSSDMLKHDLEGDEVQPKARVHLQAKTELEMNPIVQKQQQPPDSRCQVQQDDTETTRRQSEKSVLFEVTANQSCADDIAQVTPKTSTEFDTREMEREREKEVHTKDGDDVSVSSNDSVDFTLKMFLTENPVAGAARFIGKKISRRYKGGGTGSKYYRHRREDHVMRNFRLDDLKFGPELGQGFFGSVHLCTHKATGEKMAVKEMKASTDKEGCEAFQREVTLLRRLRNPNVLEFYGVFILKDHSMLLITEYISGGTLHRYLKDKSKPLTWDLRLGFLHDIAKGCSYLHLNDVIHRDLTSKNCLIRSDLSVCVADFGLARVAERRPTRMSVVGSPYWMAPEMLHGKQYNHSADVFSFGIIMGEVAARIKAEPDIFPRTNDFGVDYDGLRKLCPPEMPFDFFQLLITCTNLNPSSRPSFAECAMVMDLLGYSITDEEAIVARPNRIMRSYSFDKLGHSKLSQMLGRRVVVTEESESPSKEKSKRKSAAAKARAEREREREKERERERTKDDGETQSLGGPMEKHRSNADATNPHGNDRGNSVTIVGGDKETAIEQRHVRGSSVSVCAKRGSPPKPKVSARYAIANASVSKYKKGLAEGEGEGLGTVSTRENATVDIRPNISPDSDTGTDTKSESSTTSVSAAPSTDRSIGPEVNKLKLKGVAERAIPTTPSSPLRPNREFQSASINSGIRYSMSVSRTSSSAAKDGAQKQASAYDGVELEREEADVSNPQGAVDERASDGSCLERSQAETSEKANEVCLGKDGDAATSTPDSTVTTSGTSVGGSQDTDRNADVNSCSGEYGMHETVLSQLKIGEPPRMPRRSSEHIKTSNVSVPQADVRHRSESVRMVWKSDHSQRASHLQRASNTNKFITASHTDESTSSETCTPSLPDT